MTRRHESLLWELSVLPMSTGARSQHQLLRDRYIAEAISRAAVAHALRRSSEYGQELFSGHLWLAPTWCIPARLHVQVAALAEFRADWATAVKTYQAAYMELLRIQPVGQLPLQRWTELTSVAEVMHLKVALPL